MNVLLLGSGGREHALAWAISKSPRITRLFIAPGNPGTAVLGENVALSIDDHAGIIGFAKKAAIDLVVVGPEAPLVAGITDDLEAAGLRVFGPSKAAAQLEGSKDFTKQICFAGQIPTAAYATFGTEADCLEYLDHKGAPIVVKYDGLMAGKGVTVATTKAEAETAIRALYANEPRARVVLEDLLIGEEASYFAFVDGETVVPLGSAQDHKRVFDDDKGPNTGGMGAYSPAPVMTPIVETLALEEIVKPTARAMARRGTPYRGILFAGLMIGPDGPKLIEYNCRFGDPECQALVLRLDTDLLMILDAVARGHLADVSIRMKPHSAVGVVMATVGYPGEYAKGSEIRGVDAAEAEGAIVFHAGTRRDTDGKLLAHGGRVLTVCGAGPNLPEARRTAYDAIRKIDWPEGFCRSDIGAKGLARLTKDRS